MGTKTVEWDADVEVVSFTEDGDVSFGIKVPNCDRNSGLFEFDYTVLMNGKRLTARKRLSWRDEGDAFEVDDSISVEPGKLVSVEIVSSGTVASCEIEQEDE